ncbi:Extradiol ring-cleavage dioxygenase, class III enzyme, subunit B [Phakopsora pachyrhizi]|uniref:Extradiol ring-cleavage dioxygenase, class III enzyme, subunit B n=1 Tax=Phakopsora pachyrhizi TaxID=170000 RepID=A0AAV0AY74_PHAPC|nr:Extradiol ring-cleavage dioxygenase, class III enzyme, subunit B [Phakopsora pachyrhizi]CAH7675388.1 Extradiol ring-cleavage dioxygenase, class III enzyme, subunit B [Phakopsora pachyrhizi]
MSLSTIEGWRKALNGLPSRQEGDGKPIPTFYFAHGHPGTLVEMRSKPFKMASSSNGELRDFLIDFGPKLIEKYRPKALVVFSAHWETNGHIKVTDYGEDQPLLRDYYGFPDHAYSVEWHSDGSTELTDKVISCLIRAGIMAKRTLRSEPRGEDGVTGPASGLDHGVFIPFNLMFPEAVKKRFQIPVVQVSIAGSLKPADEIKLGQAISSLRHEGVLILAGGLTIHNFRRFEEWDAEKASKPVKEFELAIVEASLKKDGEERLKSLKDLTKLPGFRLACPREEHFAPIWIAAGAGSDQGQSQILCDLHGSKTIAYGVVA